MFTIYVYDTSYLVYSNIDTISDIDFANQFVLQYFAAVSIFLRERKLDTVFGYETNNVYIRIVTGRDITISKFTKTLHFTCIDSILSVTVITTYSEYLPCNSVQ